MYVKKCLCLFLFFSFLLGFSSEINLETQNADDVAVLEDCTGFSLAKTVSEIEGKLEKGGLPDCLDDDIIPNTASEIGAGRFPPMATYVICTP